MAIPSLKSIFEAITPENIKNIPIVQIGMEIFIEELEKNSEIAKKIRSLYDNEIQVEDDAKIRNAKEKVKSGLYNYYVYNLYNCLKNLTQSKSIQASLKKFGYDVSKLYNKAEENINTEFISSFRNYTQKVGTENAMNYIYSFARYLETGELENDLEIQKTGNPFIIHYEGALNRQIFEGINRPLSHPIGWCYTYTTMFTVMLRDYFGIEITYIFTKLEIVSKDERKYIIFTEKSVEEIYKDFRNRINPDTLLPYTDEEISANIQIFNKHVYDYQHWDEGEYSNTLITFDDDTVIYVDGRTGIIYYTDYEDYILGLKDPKSVFNEHKLVTEMRSDVKFLYYDTINEFGKDLDISRIRDSDHQIGDSQYFADNQLNALNVTGDEYLYVPGYDESINKPIEYNLDEFNHYARIQYDQDYSGLFMIKDDYNNFKIIDCSDKKGFVELNTYELKGHNYSVVFIDNNFQKFSYRSSGLNYIEKIQINTPEVFTYTITKKYGLKITGYTPFENTFITIKDSSLKTETKAVNVGFFSVTFDTSEMLQGYGKVEAYHYIVRDDKIIKKKTDISFVEISYLNNFDTTPATIGKIKYVDIANKHVYAVPTYGTDKMARINTTVDGQKIGLKISGWYNEDSWTQTYLSNLEQDTDQTLEDYYNNIYTVLSDQRVKGNIIEGEDYYKDYRTIYECSFINKGYELKDIGTSDFIVADSTRYMTDEIDVSPYGSNYYLTTQNNIGSLDDYYIVTKDKHYLVSSEIYDDVQLFVTKIHDTIEIRSTAVDLFLTFKNIDAQSLELYKKDENDHIVLFKTIDLNKYRNEIYNISAETYAYRIFGGKAVAKIDVNNKFNYTVRSVLLD